MGSNLPLPNPNPKKVTLPAVHLSSRCLETQQQVLTVLQVMGMTSSGLGHFIRQEADPEHPLKMSDSQIALEKTLWCACERMQKILDDENRWDSSFQDKVEKEYNDLHKVQMETLEAQKRASDELSTPHFRYRPALMRLRDGNWMAILGDVEHLEFAVYGIGATAQQAIEEFDVVFRRGVPSSVLEWCAKREQDLESDKPTDPFPNKEQIHEPSDDKLDDTGTSTGGQAPR